MKKNLVLTCLLLVINFITVAQTRIFKEISDEVSSQVNIIMQDNVLVGYLVFTQLEEASADLYNYKITILDENLNDVASLTFKDEKLYLKSVSFEQDVLCLAYVRSNILYKEFRNKQEYANTMKNAKNSILVQFIGLDGRIISSSFYKLSIMPNIRPLDFTYMVMANAKLKQDIRLKNIPQSGFALLYGDDFNNNLLFFNTAGVQTGQKTIGGTYVSMELLTSNQDVLVITRQTDHMVEGGYELLGYSTTDSTVYPKHVLKDKQGNSLKVLSFGNDPVSGKPYIAGSIIDAAQGNETATGADLAKGPYAGVFTITLDDYKNNKITEEFSYWNDGSKSFVTKRGYYPETKSYVKFKGAFRDYEGNTCFMGAAFAKRPKWGIIIPSIITAPLILPPIFLIAAGGTKQFQATNAVLIKQDSKNNLSLEGTIPGNSSRLYNSNGIPLSRYDNKTFYQVANSDTKTNFMVVDDVNDIFLYNANQKKLLRTIPHKEGSTLTSIFPAKEGHVLIVEHDKKEKNIIFSIESL